MREIEDLVKRLKFFWAIGNPRAQVLTNEAIEKLERLSKDMKLPVDRKSPGLICPVCGEEYLNPISSRCSSCESFADYRNSCKSYFELLDAYKGSKIRIEDTYREDDEDSLFANTSIRLYIKLELLDALFQLEGGSMPDNPLVLTASFPASMMKWIKKEIGVPADAQLTKVSFKDFNDNFLAFRFKFSEWKDENIA